MHFWVDVTEQQLFSPSPLETWNEHKFCINIMVY